MPKLGLDMPKKKERPRNSLRKTILYTSKEYASITTAHGFSYIGNEGYSRGDRILWVIIVSFAIGFTIFQMTTLYTDWQHNPVITTLDTVALPIEEIEFPAITICPQGSLEEIWDSVLFLQLKSYILNKTLEGQGKQKRSTDSQDIFWNLTHDQLMIKAGEFLEDIYPGMKYDNGSDPMPFSMLQLMRLMISDDPELTLQNEVILYPDEKCDPDCNMNVLNNLNQQLNNRFCPEGFQMSDAFECLHVKQQEMSYEQATEYCNSQDNSELLYMDSSNDFQAIETLITGMFCEKIHYFLSPIYTSSSINLYFTI